MTTTLRHPHVDPPLEIEVEPDAVAAHLRAGWLPAEADEPPTPDSEPTGEDHEEENE